jgi:hypothetical protein
MGGEGADEIARADMMKAELWAGGDGDQIAVDELCPGF